MVEGLRQLKARNGRRTQKTRRDGRVLDGWSVEAGYSEPAASSTGPSPDSDFASSPPVWSSVRRGRRWRGALRRRAGWRPEALAASSSSSETSAGVPSITGCGPVPSITAGAGSCFRVWTGTGSRLPAAAASGRSGCVLAVEIHVVLVALEAVAIVEIAAIVEVAAVVLLVPLLHLLLGGEDDAVVVLGVLKIVLRDHAVAGALRVPRQGCVLLRDRLRRAPDLHVRPGAVIGPGQRVAALAEVVVIVVIVVVAATPAAALVLLSWPHNSLTCSLLS